MTPPARLMASSSSSTLSGCDLTPIPNGNNNGIKPSRPPSQYTPSIASEDEEFFELEGSEAGDGDELDGRGKRSDEGSSGYANGSAINGYGNDSRGGNGWDEGDSGSRDSTETARPDHPFDPSPSLYATPLLAGPDSKSEETPRLPAYTNHFPSASASSAGRTKSVGRTSQPAGSKGNQAQFGGESGTFENGCNPGLGIAINIESPRDEYYSGRFDGPHPRRRSGESDTGTINGYGYSIGHDPVMNPAGPDYGPPRPSLGIASQARREIESGLGHVFGTNSSRVGSAPRGGMEQGSSAERRLRRMRYFRESAVTGMFVLSWYTFATLLSLYNKWMFSPQYYGFSFPLFVTATHMVVQFLLAWAVRVIWSGRFRPVESPSREDYGKKIVPTAFATGMDIGLSNLSLKTITLTLYTMCKSSSLIFVIGFAFLFKLERYSLRLLCVITCISFGVFLMVFDATTVSIPGIIMVFTASALGGLRWAFTQLLMHKKEMGMSNPFATIFWLAPAMAVLLAIVSMVIEGWITIFSGEFFGGWKGLQTMLFIVFPGGLAFAMVASEYYIIQRAGIVPLSIAGIFKEVSTITVSAWVFGDELTKLNELGVVVTIGGIALYSYHKYQKSVLEPEDDPHRAHDLESYEAYESLGLQAQEGAYPSQRLSFAGDGAEDEEMDGDEGGKGGAGHHVIGDEDDDEDELVHSGSGRLADNVKAGGEDMDTGESDTEAEGIGLLRKG